MEIDLNKQWHMTFWTVSLRDFLSNRRWSTYSFPSISNGFPPYFHPHLRSSISRWLKNRKPLLPNAHWYGYGRGFGYTCTFIFLFDNHLLLVHGYTRAFNKSIIFPFDIHLFFPLVFLFVDAIILEISRAFRIRRRVNLTNSNLFLAFWTRALLSCREYNNVIRVLFRICRALGRLPASSLYSRTPSWRPTSTWRQKPTSLLLWRPSLVTNI